MTSKELRKLSRRELLEMLISQSKELNQVQQELDEANRQLNERRILLENCGSIAEAALKLNHVFEAAQAAADHYLESVLGGEDAAMPCLDAEAKANEILQNAENERMELLERTRQECDEMIARAQEECRHMEYEALRQDLGTEQEAGSDD